MKRIGLGIDVGGTATRWQLNNDLGECLAEGFCPSLTGVMHNEHQRRYTQEIILNLVEEANRYAQPTHVVAGITGYGGRATASNDDAFYLSLSKALPQARLLLVSDVLMSYFCVFEPGEGYLAYAGTGSMSAFVDAQFVLHRAGGRGFVIDDAGSGFWMAKEALRRIWQARDTYPDAHLHSPLADALYNAMGGSDWGHTRDYIYTRQRGDIGRLAIHLASFVDSDPLAHEVVADAGHELARLEQAQITRHGLRPIAVGGGAAHIHPLYFQTFVAALPAQANIRLVKLQTQHHAARLASQADEQLWQGIEAAISTTT